MNPKWTFYRKRTGRRGNFRYWYGKPGSRKIYEGPPPPSRLIQQHPKEERHPLSHLIVPNPWQDFERYDNTEMIVSVGEEVPFNRMHITRWRDLERAENEQAPLVTRFLHRQTSGTPITSALMCRVHKIYFGPVHFWAGRYRTVNLEKAGYRWIDYTKIPQGIAHLDRQIFPQVSPGRPDWSFDMLCKKAAILIAEINFVHPFREGNGRVARALATLICLQANYPEPLWAYSGEEKEAFIATVREGYDTAYADLAEVVRQAILRQRTQLGETVGEGGLPPFGG